MVPSELTGEVSMGVISISSVLEMGPLYRPGPTRRYSSFVNVAVMFLFHIHQYYSLQYGTMRGLEFVLKLEIALVSIRAQKY